MNNLEIYKKWAPKDSIWSAWAKPVLFASLMDTNKHPLRNRLPAVEWAKEIDKPTAIILDLPDDESILTALSLLEYGYRPVPLYNCCSDATMIIDVSNISRALHVASEYISNTTFHPDAPPAFLLDSRRMESTPALLLDSRRMEATPAKVPRKVNNRWCVFPQDMPSAKFLIKSGIHSILLCSESIQTDISHILCRYQEHGIKIHLLSSKGLIEYNKITPPSKYRKIAYRWASILGLKRNSVGGFGGSLPNDDSIEQYSTSRHPHTPLRKE